MARLSRRLALGAAAAGALATPTLIKAQAPLRWRMVTSWARNLPGPGVSAQRLAERIAQMSGGQLKIEVFAAGEIVPALSVFEAVANGTVEMAHSAALFWAGKLPAAPIFTSMPFGLAPIEHAAWIDQGGQALWDALYAPSGVRAFLAGNTGPSTAGWFRKRLTGLADLAGLRIRVTGLGGEVYRRLGATPLALSPSETYPALERGVIDAAEFLAPSNDRAMGLQRVAPYLAWPGFNKPNGASELLLGIEAFARLPEALQAIIRAACRAEHDQGLAEAEYHNAASLRPLIEAGAQLMPLPTEILEAAQGATRVLIAELRERDALAARIVDSYAAAREAGIAWRRMQGFGQILAR